MGFAGDIEIYYNHLNLPEKIQEESGTGDELLYIYDANGTKWLKKLTDGSTITKTMYAGSFVYEDTDNNGTDEFGLDYILNPEGMIDKLTSSVEYLYNLQDHLGNIRVVFDGAGTVKQKTDYYPFGMTSYQYSSSNDNKYLFNGKELQDEQLGGINLDWYDYGARMYDPQLGRWHTPDPLAEYHFNMTPYHYVFNNPMMFTDPFGLDSIAPNNPGGSNNPIPLPGITVKRPGLIKRTLKKIGDFFSAADNALEGEGGSQNGGIPFVTSGDTYSPTKQGVEHTEEQVNVDDLLPAMKGIGKSPTPTIGPLTPAKEINRVGKIIKEVQGATSDKEIRENSTGSSDAASPENQTIVKTYKVDTVFYVDGKDTVGMNIRYNPRPLKGLNKGWTQMDSSKRVMFDK